MWRVVGVGTVHQDVGVKGNLSCLETVVNRRSEPVGVGCFLAEEDVSFRFLWPRIHADETRIFYKG